jgi:glycosyltransferase involved in cell wall biosynthesis
MKFPRRILVISTWAPPKIGGPQNFYNLFSQFPPDSYTILTSYAEIWEGGKLSSWLPGAYVFFDYRHSFSQKDKKRALPPGPQTLTRIDWFMYRIRRYWLKAVRQLAAPAFTLWKIWTMTSLGVKTVKRKQIDLILGISDNGPALIATYLVSKLTRTPYCLYLYDLYKGNYLPPLDVVLAYLFERLLFTNASLVILTNEGTEHFYQRRYGRSIRTAVVHNSVFAESYERNRTPYRPKSPYQIVFTGYVYWPQKQAVMNLIRGMDLLRDLPVKLDLYVPKPDDELQRAASQRPNIRLLSAPQSAMPKIQGQATLLYLPLSWGTKGPSIIATATPGKFTDYLASGRPMLIHAPDYAYVAQYSKKHKLGLVVDRNDVSELAKTIREFLRNPLQGQQLIQNALHIFYQNHQATKNARKLMSLLTKI